jgi:hypothetical protein
MYWTSSTPIRRRAKVQAEATAAALVDITLKQIDAAQLF